MRQTVAVSVRQERDNMFEVIEKKTKEKYIVYNVKTDNRTGYPHFLIYDNVWVWKSAKYFIPVTSN